MQATTSDLAAILSVKKAWLTQKMMIHRQMYNHTLVQSRDTWTDALA